jgi:hypothetical protein
MPEQKGTGKPIAQSDSEMAATMDGVQDCVAYDDQIGVKLTLEKLLEAANIVKEVLLSLN